MRVTRHSLSKRTTKAKCRDHYQTNAGVNNKFDSLTTILPEKHSVVETLAHRSHSVVNEIHVCGVNNEFGNLIGQITQKNFKVLFKIGKLLDKKR